MKRPDAEMIKLIQKAGLISRKHLEWGCNLPYFYMSYKLMGDFAFVKENVLSDHEWIEERSDGSALLRHYGKSAEFVYNDFVLSCRGVIHPQHHYHRKAAAVGAATDVNYWGWVHRDGGHDLVFLIIQYPSTKHWFVWKGVAEIAEETGQGDDKVIKYHLRMAPEYEEKMRPWHKKAVDEGRLPQSHSSFGAFMSGLTNQAGAYYLFVHKLMEHIKYGDKHAVEVVSEKPPKAAKSIISRNRPWLAAKGPRVLLLDRMPTTQGPGTGTHASPKPHRRRGHWKTLSHPRYRHHPQYQKKIYVKPSFVGPKQATYEGNIYRLVQPLEETIYG